MLKVFLRELTTLLLTPVVFVLMPFILLFRYKVEDTATPKQQPEVQRYKLPNWLSWFETPDELLPAGLYEPTCMKWYNRYGSFICSWLWLGTRNVLHGFQWRYGKPASNYLALLTEEQQKEQGIYRKETNFLFLKFISGYSVYRDRYSVYTDDGFWAVESFSIRMRNQD